MVDWDWWVTLRDPRDIMAKHPTLILNEIVFYVLALLSLKHAARNGGRWKYLWLATIIHGLTTESVSYFVPGIDNFWHAQSSVMFLGKRLPLHIIFFYPVIIYQSYAAVSCLGLPFWAEPFAVGLGDLLIDLPYDIMGIKLLWWTWHDTDPNIYDRHYCVPWTSYIFHMSFACCFVFLMELGRKTITGNVSKAISSGIVKEMAVALLAGIFTFPLAVLTQFVPLYHIPHDIYKIHTENIVMVQLDRNGPRDEPSRIVSVSWLHHEAGQGILLNSLFFLLLVTMAKPEQQVSVGLHQTLGPCNVSEALTSVLGQTLYRHAYLCAGDYVEGTFDWHCLPGAEPPPDGTEWYPICGTPFYHHAEYIYTVSAFCLLGIAFYWTVLRRWAQPAKRVKYD
ncbi:uncharacterized protein LOC125463976 isoform X2 [Stegostoma tigrinum]|uniref:uncharacterized protein LOC125463976 isoform X2 n=1 Tax=Stegostoma tigrinum TaxID=3053191 RepID=UPI00202AE7FE|nr:uncharacterized protein LOC125463976 isoform X2 [Stegostoma tigrinum]